MVVAEVMVGMAALAAKVEVMMGLLDGRVRLTALLQNQRS